MNSDQGFYGYHDWHLPSPSSTPKSTTYNETLLQTPKVDSASTHFLDAYSTPHINGHTTPVQTPVLSKPTASTPIVDSHTHQTPDQPEFHVNHFSSSNRLPLPPVDPARRLSSSPGPLLAEEDRGEELKSRGVTANGQAASKMDSSFMQTPPPTRDSSRRKLAAASGQSLTTPSTIAARSTSTPLTGFHTGHTLFTQTPVQFPSLPFSPEAVQFPNAGPASAPIFPQSRLFWDQSQDNTSRDVDMTNIPQDPFGPTPQRPSEAFVWPFASPVPQSHPKPFHNAMNAQLPGHPVSSGPAESSAQTGNFSFPQADSFLTSAPGVDPSMLFSFHNSTSPFDDAMGQPVPPTMDSTARQPYEHQTRESLREKEEARKVKQNHSRSSTASSSMSFGNSVRPGLQRSKTEGNFRPGHSLPVDTRGSGGGLPHIPRKNSPLKRLSAGLSSIPEFSKNRPRTRLVIDESGHARTETDFNLGENEPRADPRAQYPGLWSDDESASEDDKPVNSRPNSFIFDPPVRRSSKHGRIDSLGRSGSMKKARPSSMIALDSLFDKPENVLDSTPDPRRFSIPNLNGSFGISPNKEATLSPTEGAGHAQNALKKVVEDRMRRQERSAQNTLKAHNQRWSQASAELTRPPSGQSINIAAFSDALNGSPGTMTDFTELDTPSTNRSTLSNGSTRCVCNSTEGEGLLMIQCESCTKWLHTRCVGLNDQNLPSVYLCVFCTTTPARGGRIRENMRPMTTYASPLTHKSTYRR